MIARQLIGPEGRERMGQMGSDRAARSEAIDVIGVLIAGVIESGGAPEAVAVAMVLDWRESPAVAPAITAYIRSRRTSPLRDVLGGQEPWWVVPIPAAGGMTVREIAIADLITPLETS